MVMRRDVFGALLECGKSMFSILLDAHLLLIQVLQLLFNTQGCLDLESTDSWLVFSSEGLSKNQVHGCIRVDFPSLLIHSTQLPAIILQLIPCCHNCRAFLKLEGLELGHIDRHSGSVNSAKSLLQVCP